MKKGFLKLFLGFCTAGLVSTSFAITVELNCKGVDGNGLGCGASPIKINNQFPVKQPRFYYKDKGKWSLMEGWKMDAKVKGLPAGEVPPEIVLKVTPSDGGPEACKIKSYNQNANICVDQSLFAVSRDNQSVVLNAEMPTFYYGGSGFNPKPADHSIEQQCYGGKQPDDSPTSTQSLTCSADVKALVYQNGQKVAESQKVQVSAEIVHKDSLEVKPPLNQREVSVDVVYHFPNDKTCKPDPDKPSQCQVGTINTYVDYYKKQECDKGMMNLTIAPWLKTDAFPTIIPRGSVKCAQETIDGEKVIVNRFQLPVAEASPTVLTVTPNATATMVREENGKVTDTKYLPQYFYKDKDKKEYKSAEGGVPGLDINIPVDMKELTVHVYHNTQWKAGGGTTEYGTLGSGVTTKNRFAYGTFQAYMKPSDIGGTISAFYTYFNDPSLADPEKEDANGMVNGGYTWHEFDFEFTPGKHPMSEINAFLDDGFERTFASTDIMDKSVSLNLILTGNKDFRQPSGRQHHAYCPNPNNPFCFPKSKPQIPNEFPFDKFRLYTIVWDYETVKFYYELEGKNHLAYEYRLKEYNLGAINAATSPGKTILEKHFFAQDRTNGGMVIDEKGKAHPTTPQRIALNLWQFSDAGDFGGAFDESAIHNKKPIYDQFKVVRWSPCVAPDGSFVPEGNCPKENLIGKVYSGNGDLAPKDQQHAYEWCFASNVNMDSGIACNSSQPAQHAYFYKTKQDFLKDKTGWAYIPQLGWSQNASIFVQNNTILNKDGLSFYLTPQWDNMARWDSNFSAYHPAIGMDKKPLLPVPGDNNNFHQSLLNLHLTFGNNKASRAYGDHINKGEGAPNVFAPEESFPADYPPLDPNDPNKTKLVYSNNDWSDPTSGKNQHAEDGCGGWKPNSNSRIEGKACNNPTSLYSDSWVARRSSDPKAPFEADQLIRFNAEYLSTVDQKEKSVVLKKGWADHLIGAKGVGLAKNICCKVFYSSNNPVIKDNEETTLSGGETYDAIGTVWCELPKNDQDSNCQDPTSYRYFAPPAWIEAKSSNDGKSVTATWSAARNNYDNPQIVYEAKAIDHASNKTFTGVVNGLSATFTGLTPETEYEIKLTVSDKTSRKEFCDASNEFCFTTSTKTNVTTNGDTQGNHVLEWNNPDLTPKSNTLVDGSKPVILKWNPATVVGNSGAEIQYQIKLNGVSKAILKNQTTYELTGLEFGKTYKVEVVATTASVTSSKLAETELKTMDKLVPSYIHFSPASQRAPIVDLNIGAATGGSGHYSYQLFLNNARGPATPMVVTPGVVKVQRRTAPVGNITAVVKVTDLGTKQEVNSQQAEISN